MVVSVREKVCERVIRPLSGCGNTRKYEEFEEKKYEEKQGRSTMK